MTWQDVRLHKRLTLNPSHIERVYSIISEIDSVKKSLQITANLLPQTIERLTHSVIITSTGSSNRIEGNRVSDSEVKSLYKNMHIKEFKTRDEQEVVGYLQNLELIFKNYNDIRVSESSILTLHRDMLIYSEKDLHHKGHYKVGHNRVEAKNYKGNIVGVIFDPTPPYLVKKEMQELVDWYNWAVGMEIKHPLILTANFIFECLAIHPFQDGNGRSSRLLTNLLLLQHGYSFASIVSHERIIEANKADYYLALNQTQNNWKTEAEDISPWLIFFLEAIKTQSAQAFSLIKGNRIDHLLSEKQLALWQWINTQEEFSRQDAVKALGFPERTIESIIKKLLDLKRLKRLGQGKATRYKLSRE